MKLPEARRLIREHILKSLPEIKAKRSRKVPIGRKTPAYDPNDSFHVDAINNFLELCKQYGTENVANALLNTYENFVDMGFEGAELKALHQAKIEEFKTTHSDFFKQWVQDLADDSLQEIRVKSDPLREIKPVRSTKIGSGRPVPKFIIVDLSSGFEPSMYPYRDVGNDIEEILAVFADTLEKHNWGSYTKTYLNKEKTLGTVAVSGTGGFYMVINARRFNREEMEVLLLEDPTSEQIDRQIDIIYMLGQMIARDQKSEEDED